MEVFVKGFGVSAKAEDSDSCTRTGWSEHGDVDTHRGEYDYFDCFAGRPNEDAHLEGDNTAWQDWIL